MGRRGDPDEFLSLLDRVRAAMPDVVLRTTLIAGFPGETDDDIEILEGFLREAAIEHVGVFTYSPEDGTPAALLPDRVAPELAAERARSLRAIADDAADARFRSLIGSTLDVLVEDVEDGTPVGRWYGQAPEIDGVVHIEGDVRIGAFVRARVLDAIGHDLVTRVEA